MSKFNASQLDESNDSTAGMGVDNKRVWYSCCSDLLYDGACC